MTIWKKQGSFYREKERGTQKFLEYMGLTYDEQITHSIVLRKEKEIIATASCQKNIIKCVAVSEAYQGQNLLAHLMTSLIEYFYGMGISHFWIYKASEQRTVFQHGNVSGGTDRKNSSSGK